MVGSKLLGKERHEGLVLSAMGIGIRLHLLAIRYFFIFGVLRGEKRERNKRFTSLFNLFLIGFVLFFLPR